MGILSKLRKRKGGEVKEEKKEKIEDVDLAKTLAMYIVSAEILMAEFVESEHPFVRLYDQFRREWKLEEILKPLGGYDEIFKTVYKEVIKWLEQSRSS